MTNPQNLPAVFNDSAAAWERALYAFLSEKERRSGSRRTLESYYRMLQHFFRTLSKTPDDVTSQDVFAFAHGRGLSGREPSGITIGARLSCLSSFFKFLIRMEIVKANPCDAVERPRTQPSPPRGLSADQVKLLLDIIPDTVKGIRDRAIILTLVLTGRRRTQVIDLKSGNISVDGDVAFYICTGKGGKKGRRELPLPALEAIETSLSDIGKELWSLSKVIDDDPVSRCLTNSLPDQHRIIVRKLAGRALEVARFPYIAKIWSIAREVWVMPSSGSPRIGESSQVNQLS